MPELTQRYIVMSMATHAPFDPGDADGAFVLKPWKDPAALQALKSYRDHCYPELRRDLDAWIQVIEAGPVVRGDVGRRNEPYAAPAAPRTAARRPARSARRPGRGEAPRASRHGSKRSTSHRKKRRR